MSSKAINLTGKRFGRLVVLRRGDNKGKEPQWVCQCDCGAKSTPMGVALRNGHTNSCGCIAREVTRARSVRHGLTDTPEWRAWTSMKARCHSPSHRNFAGYGGRGISVCDRWRESFENFFADMGTRPSPDHQLDRVDNCGGYGPENCRWATRPENMRNRRVTVRYGGMTLREISEMTGENYYTLKTRAFRGMMQRDT